MAALLGGISLSSLRSLRGDVSCVVGAIRNQSAHIDGRCKSRFGNVLTQRKNLVDEAVKRRLAKGGNKQNTKIVEHKMPDPKTTNTEGKAVNSSQVFLYTPTFIDRVILVLAGKYSPTSIPQQVAFGTMNTAWSRVRITAYTITFFGSMYICELAMDEGRAARDGGDECLYNDPQAQELQQRKRDFWDKQANVNAA